MNMSDKDIQISRQVQQDIARSAQRHQLAADAKPDDPTFIAQIRPGKLILIAMAFTQRHRPDPAPQAPQPRPQQRPRHI